jgi:hypothetical protein
MICSCTFGDAAKDPAMYTAARANGNIEKSKLYETEAARRVPLSAPNSFSDAFSKAIVPLINGASP